MLTVQSKLQFLLEILETLRFRGSIFFHSKLAAPWGLALTPISSPRIHIATFGACTVGTAEGESVRLAAMEVVMLPNGNEHWIADKSGRPLVASEQAGQACELNNPMFQVGEITNGLICGLVHFDSESTHPMLETLPAILHFSGIDHDTPIWTTVTAIDHELRRGSELMQPVVDRLTEVLFLQLLERYVSETQEPMGFFAALNDRRVYQALTLLHQQPEIEWSLHSLGEKTGMSRATLGRRFQDAVGMTPMAYLNHWRVMKAHNLILYSQDSLAQIAQSVGFSSSKMLSKAFQRTYDQTPSEVRRSKRDS